MRLLSTPAMMCHNCIHCRQIITDKAVLVVPQPVGPVFDGQVAGVADQIS